MWECDNGDANDDGQMTVDEILMAVHDALKGAGEPGGFVAKAETARAEPTPTFTLPDAAELEAGHGARGNPRPAGSWRKRADLTGWV
jgi:hypothetical protein